MHLVLQDFQTTYFVSLDCVWCPQVESSFSSVTTIMGGKIISIPLYIIVSLQEPHDHNAGLEYNS